MIFVRLLTDKNLKRLLKYYLTVELKLLNCERTVDRLLEALLKDNSENPDNVNRYISSVITIQINIKNCRSKL